MIIIVGGKILTMAGDIWDKGYLCISMNVNQEHGVYSEDIRCVPGKGKS